MNARDGLPAVLTTYLAAHQAHDADTAISSFAADAVVIDDGQTYRGADEIRSWLRDAASEYTYTTEITGISRIDDSHIDVAQHLEGDFPGGVVDLRYRFTLADAQISQLLIEP